MQYVTIDTVSIRSMVYTIYMCGAFWSTKWVVMAACVVPDVAVGFDDMDRITLMGGCSGGCNEWWNCSDKTILYYKDIKSKSQNFRNFKHLEYYNHVENETESTPATLICHMRGRFDKKASNMTINIEQARIHWLAWKTDGSIGTVWHHYTCITPSN